MIPKKLPQFLSADATRKLIEHVRHLKHRIMIDIMYSLALRVSELTDIRICDIDQDKLIIRIIGKGSRERLLPCNERVWSLIIDVLQIYKPKTFLFEDSYGTAFGTRQVRQIVYNAADAAMIGHCHPHMLRHSKATHLVQKHVDLNRIQRLLGHANLETTAVYLHLETDDLRSVLEIND
jgi:site-specific recombinase XerD